jgi:hypothetical protein
MSAHRLLEPAHVRIGDLLIARTYRTLALLLYLHAPAHLALQALLHLSDYTLALQLTCGEPDLLETPRLSLGVECRGPPPPRRRGGVARDPSTGAGLASHDLTLEWHLAAITRHVI